MGMDLGEISFRITAQADGIQAAFNQAGKEIEQFVKQEASAGQGATNMGKEVSKGAEAAQNGLNGLAQSAKDADAATVAAFGAMAAAAAKAMSAVMGAINDGVAAYNQYTAAMKGLQSIASFKGVDTSQLQGALAQLEDQFIDTASASAALKNLLSRGYSLEQAVNTISRLKDAAAFGRQANYDLAEAVVSATEGLKNENSILVDNAGVTKNVAKMWQDYAKARGLSTQSMTQQQKIEAEYLGIMEETAGQVGNAAEAANTLAGAQATTSKSAREMAIAFGSALSPAVELVNTALAGITGTIKEFVTAAPALTAGLSSAAVAIGGLFAASKAADAIALLGAKFAAAASGVSLFGGAITLTMPWLAGIAGVIGLAVTAYTAIKKSAEAAAEAEKKAAEARKQEIVDIKTTAGDMRQLASEYEKLSAKQNKTTADKMRMAEIEEQLANYQTILAEKYGESTPAIMENAGAHELNAKKINEEADALERLAEGMQGEDDGKGAEERYGNLVKELKDLSDAYKVAAEYRENYANRPGFEEEYENAAEEATQLANLIEETQQKISEEFAQKVLAGLRASGVQISEETADIAKSIALALSDGFDVNLQGEWEEGVTEAISAISGSSVIQSALADVREVSEKVMNGVAPSEQDKEKISDAYTTLFNEIIDALPGDLMLDESQLSGIVASAVQTAFGDAIKLTGDAIGGDFSEFYAYIAELAQENAEKMRVANAEAALGLKAGWLEAAQASTNAASEISDASGTLASAVGAATGAANAAINDYKAAVDDMVAKSALYAKVSGKSFEEMVESDAESIEALQIATGKAITSAEDYNAAVLQLGSDMMRVKNNINDFKLPALNDAKKTISETINNLQAVLAETPDTPLFATIRRQIAESISDLIFMGKTITRTKKDYEGFVQSGETTSQSPAAEITDIAKETKNLTSTYKDAEKEFQKWQNYLNQFQEMSFADAMGKDADLVSKLSDDLGMVIDEESWQSAIDLVKEYANATGDAATYSLGALQDSYEKLGEEIDATKAKKADAAEGSDEYQALAEKLNRLELAYIAAGIAIDNYSAKAAQAADTTQGATTVSAEDNAKAANEAASAYMEAQDKYQKLAETVNEVSSYKNFDEAMANNEGAVKSLSDQLGMSITTQGEYDAAMKAAKDELSNLKTASDETKDALTTANEALAASIADVKAQMEAEAAAGRKDGETYKNLQKRLNALQSTYTKTSRAVKNYEAYAKKVAKTSAESTRAQKKENKEWDITTATVQQAIKYVKSLVNAKKQLDTALSKIENIEKTGGSLKDVQEIINQLPPELQFVAKSFDQAKKQLRNSSDGMNNLVNQAISKIEGELQTYQDALHKLESGGATEIKINGTVYTNINTDSLRAKIAEIQNLLAQLNKLAKTPGVGGGGGGGGGGKKESEYSKEQKQVQHRVNMLSEFDRNATQKEYNMYLAMYNKYIKQLNAIDNSRMSEKQKKKAKEKLMTEDERKSLEETLKNLRETLRKEAFDKDMAYYDHAVAMGRMSTKKQIEYLKKVLKTHKLTREERWQLEEQIYDLEQELADKAKEKEKKRLDDLKKKAEEAKQKAKEALEKQKEHAQTVYDQLVEALRNRYNKERELRKQALNDQIAALEAEQNAEEEARQRQEYEEQLAEKQRQLRIEKSARKRRELQAEIDKMILDEERRLADNARQAQIDDLNRQIDAVDKMYDGLTSDENLNKEALALAMSGNMKAMERIINDYTPKFEDAGTALMDYLTTGITKKKTTLLNALSGVFDDASKEMQNQIKQFGKASTSVSSSVYVNLSIGQINEASDYETVTDRLQAAVRSATRGKR